MTLHGKGPKDEAIAVLEATLKQRSNDAHTLRSFAAYLRDAGHSERAVHVQRQLDALGWD
jgi:hypothetical protein